MAEVQDVTAGMSMKSYQDDTVIPGINTENAIKKTPIVGDAVQLGKDSVSAYKQVFDGKTQADGADIAMGVTTIALDAKTLIQSGSQTIVDIATDPLGWLIGQGLSFLINVVQPVQDAIHFVSGDGPALSKAAENFGALAKALQDMSVNFDQVADERLAGWAGDAGTAAKKGLAEFSSGMNGVAAKAGDMAQMLQLNSMVMTFIEELIKAILTEVISWLITLWVPAIAAAVPTCGASTAAAGAATPPKLAATATKTTGFVNRLRKLLSDVLAWLRKMQAKLADSKMGKFLTDGNRATDRFADRMKDTKSGKGYVDALMGEKGMLGKRLDTPRPVFNATKDAVDVDATLRGEMLRDVGKAAKDGVVKGLTGSTTGDWQDKRGRAILDAGGKVIGYVKDGKKAVDHGDRGQEQSDQETKNDLDF
ncbi:WXG100 family type VII secretion target [Amycolatopsis sp. lyj-90]|uniref:WXG100 family type VII secretion target n=1 Tax=Amycolatopsis sp. lyj-90 TaxID=2789285 RepID=UPI0039798CD5